ncbi:MAG TPA: carboxypeptidase regulatory-like domain-containing protein, partial [Chitinophagales bacterium]|nr:carboxypeptidase regulatory-like domain-containing protein [Chitinophagales bacterium]
VHAQQFTQTLRGTVSDEDSKTPLAGATVVVTSVEPQLGVLTNDRGEFTIENVPVGRHSIYASRLGYQPLVLNNVVVSSGKELRLNFELEPQVYQTQTVVIQDSALQRETVNPLVTASGQSFSPEETRRYAGSRQDPSRMVSNFAGVNGGNDARNEIVVRGNSPIGVLWQLEGMEIPNPNHFTGVASSGGALSILNNELLSQSDFLTGAFPAEYGNKTAAVFDLRLRNGNNEKREHTFALGINGLEAGSEGPFNKNKRSSYLLNYRYSTMAVFDALGLKFGISGTPTYQDGTLKLHFPSRDNKWMTSLFFIGGVSNVQIRDAEKDSTDWSYTNAGEDVNYGTAMYAAGVNVTRFTGSNGYWRIGLVNGAQMLDITLDTLIAPDEKMRLITNRSVEGWAATKLSYTRRFTQRHTVRSGVQMQVPYYDYRVQFRDPVLKIYLDRLRGNGYTERSEAYAHWQYRVTDKLKFNNGVYYQHLFLNNTWSVEPRLGANYSVGKHNLKLAYGLHSQMQPLVTYFLETYDTLTKTYAQTNRNLDFTRAHHGVIGYDVTPVKNVLIKTE